MRLDDALSWYSDNRFTADDVTRATGLSERSQRELLKIGVLQPVPQAKTKTRLLNEHMVKRASIVAPLNQHGLSLKVSGKIVYSAVMLEDFMFDIIDPIDQIFDTTGKWDPVTRLPPRRPNADKHGWFDPSKPARCEEGDHFIEITNGRFVSTYGAGPDPIIYGELTADQSDIVVWWGSVWNELIEPTTVTPEAVWTLGGMFGPNLALSPELRKYQWKKPSDEDKERAYFAWQNPISKLRVNADLTLRRALRRLLYIDPVE